MKSQDIINKTAVLGALSSSARTARRAVSGLALLGMSAAAMAQGTGTGWERMFSNLTSLGKTGATAVTALAFLAGLVALAYGGKLLWDKGGERGEDIKMGRIVFTIVGGTVMIALGFIATQTVETLGGQQSDIGTPISTK
jgi:hypothetical protein